jgi:hypothetical protein
MYVHPVIHEVQVVQLFHEDMFHSNATNLKLLTVTENYQIYRCIKNMSSPYV